MEVQIHVENMTCHNCSKVLRHALESIPGVMSVVIKKALKNIILQIDETQVGLNQIVEAIEAKGYAAKIQHAVKKAEIR